MRLEIPTGKRFIVGMGDWTPAEITVETWWDASDTDTITDSGGAVSQWNDKSGNNNHLTQGTASAQPVTGTRTINGLNVIDWDDNSPQDRMQLTNVITDGAPFAAFVVAQFDNVNSNAIVYDSTNNRYTQLGEVSATNNIIFRLGADEGGGINFTGANGSSIGTDVGLMEFWVETGGAAYASINGALSGTSAGTWTATDYEISRLGRNGSDSMDGRLAEVILMVTEPSEADRQKIEGYLAHKWGFAGSLPVGHPYKNTPPVA